MAETLMNKIDRINEELRSLGREAVQEIKMINQEGKVIGQVKYDYRPQYVFDCVNRFLGPENWKYELSKEEIFDRQAVAEVRLFIRIDSEWLCKGSQKGQMQIVKNNVGDARKGAITDALQKVEGAYSFIIQSRSKMYAVRDRYGFRPLSLARLGDGYMVASETCAFDLVGAEFIRDIEPGEMLIFEKGKAPKSIRVFEPNPHMCIFEYIYFARPDSVVFGKNVYSLRKKMGEELAKELPVEADMVVPVPDSGVAAALGYSQHSGIPFELGIMRNHYVGRTFIEPTQELRNLKVKMKLSPIREVIEGKRLIVIDDSIVRGTTSKQIVSMLKEAGAKEVHMRISSPPTTGPCYYGVDTPDKEKLISARMSTEEVCEYIGADSLAFISIDGMMRAVGDDQNYCKACFDGNYIV